MYMILPFSYINTIQLLHTHIGKDNHRLYIHNTDTHIYVYTSIHTLLYT